MPVAVAILLDRVQEKAPVTSVGATRQAAVTPLKVASITRYTGLWRRAVAAGTGQVEAGCT